jgi:hypothetical protein
MINKMKTLKRIIPLIALICFVTFNESKGQYILPALQGSSFVPLQVTTLSITQITNSTALGMVQISGSLNIAETKGLCWSRTNTMPDINDDIGTYTGNSFKFTVSMTGMNKKRTYYARAFVTYGGETIYGNLISFTTGDNGFVTDGKVKFITMRTLGGVYSNDESQLTQQTSPGFGNVISSGTANINVVLDFTNTSKLNSAGISVSANGENFSILTSGFFVPSETGTYTFTCEGDDAVDLKINGIVVASHYGGHAVGSLGSHVGTMTLTKNTKYSFEARMQEFAGQEALRVFWRKPSQTSGWFQDTAEISSY